MTLQNAVSLIGGLLVIASVIGVVAAFTRANLAKTTIELLNLEVKALKGRVGTLESEKAADNRRMEGLEAKNRVLEDLATGKSAIESLGRKLDQHHVEVLTRLEAMA